MALHQAGSNPRNIVMCLRSILGHYLLYQTHLWPYNTSYQDAITLEEVEQRRFTADSNTSTLLKPVTKKSRSMSRLDQVHWVLPQVLPAVLICRIKVFIGFIVNPVKFKVCLKDAFKRIEPQSLRSAMPHDCSKVKTVNRSDSASNMPKIRRRRRQRRRRRR